MQQHPCFNHLLVTLVFPRMKTLPATGVNSELAVRQVDVVILTPEMMDIVGV